MTSCLFSGGRIAETKAEFKALQWGSAAHNLIIIFSYLDRFIVLVFKSMIEYIESSYWLSIEPKRCYFLRHSFTHLANPTVPDSSHPRCTYCSSFHFWAVSDVLAGATCRFSKELVLTLSFTGEAWIARRPGSPTHPLPPSSTAAQYASAGCISGPQLHAATP